MKFFTTWLAACALVLGVTSAQAEEDFLEPDAAFAFSVEMKDSTTARASWAIASGYYLYRDRIQITSPTPGITVGQIILPSAKLKNDPNFGDVYIYKGQLAIDIPMTGTGTRDVLVKYQGCAEAGLCYPPQKKTVSLTPANSAAKSPITMADLMGKASSTSAVTNSSQDLLTPEQAFSISTETKEGKLSIAWKVAQGYYLYQDRLTINGKPIDKTLLPTAETKKDPAFGDVQVYKHNFSVSIPLSKELVSASIGWQGCAEAGVCYPPQTQTVALNSATSFEQAENADLSETDQITNMLSGGNIWLTIAFFFGVGLLLAFTPCVFPMIPILSSIIVGQGATLTTRRAFILSLVYVLAMALTYTAAGVLAGLFGANLQAAFQNPWILVSFSAIFVVLAFSMFGFFELQLPASVQAKLADVSNKQQGGTLTGVAIMGLLSALIVGPCVAPPLAGALIYIGQTGDALLGGLALFALSMGMGLPLIAVGTAAGKYMPRAGGWMDNVKAVFGVALLAVAVWMLSRVLPEVATMLLWAMLAIASAVYLGALEAAQTGWHKLWKALGIALLLWGAFLLIAAASGGNSSLQPLSHLVGKGTGISGETSAASSHGSFRKVASSDELDAVLAEAKASNTPVMFDFYADWCVSCKEMESFTFADPQVAQRMKSLRLVQVDMTDNTDAHKALLKRFGLVGPPAILFFNAQGEEQKALRVVGFMKADKFLQQLDKVVLRK